MRVLDRASVDRGFCPDTGFDIDDMKGYDGYTGYNWDDRYPFIKSKFEELAKEEEEKAEDRKKQGRTGKDTETRGERIHRINETANSRREHYLDVVKDGEFDSSEQDSDTVQRSKDIRTVRKMDYNDLPGTLITQLTCEETTFIEREKMLKEEEDKHQSQGDSKKAQKWSRERAQSRKERRNWKKENLRKLSEAAFTRPNGGDAMKLKAALKTQVCEWVYSSDSEDSSLDRAILWARNVEHYHKHKATVSPEILAEISLPLSIRKEKRDKLKRDLAKEIYEVKGGAKRAENVGKVMWECRKKGHDIPIEIVEQICGERQLHEEATKYVAEMERKEKGPEPEQETSFTDGLRHIVQRHEHGPPKGKDEESESWKKYQSSTPHWSSRSTAENCGKSVTPDQFPAASTNKELTITRPSNFTSELRQRTDEHGEELWREDGGDTEMNTALPETEHEMYDWAEKTQLAISALATELAEMKYEQSLTQSSIKQFDKRQKITESRVARLTDSEKKTQREKVERCLDMRGLWIPDLQRYATPAEREATFFWVADYIKIHRNSIKQTHGPPNKKTTTDRTRITFDTVDMMTQWKRFINHMNTTKGIQIWDPVKRCSFPKTKIYWEEVKTDYDRTQGLVLKCCAACLRADDLFYDENSRCTIIEVSTETKIIDKSSGKIIVQIVVDETKNTPVQEVYTHVIAEQILMHNWNENWKLIWDSQFGPKGESKGSTRRRGKGQKSASEESARQEYNQQRESERSERNEKWAKVQKNGNNRANLRKGGEWKGSGQQNKRGKEMGLHP